MLLDAGYNIVAEDFYQQDMPKQCWQCEYFDNKHGARICTSHTMRQAVRDMMGVEFTCIALGVTKTTDAMLCDSWELSRNPDILGEVEQDIEEFRENERRHADHYNHLRRTVA